MHFSKEYSRLLHTLPPNLSANAVQYRQLKKLINQVVFELASFGLNPTVVRELLRADLSSRRSTDGENELRVATKQLSAKPLNVVYEFNNDGTSVQPLLRLTIGSSTQDEPAAATIVVGSDINNDTLDDQTILSSKLLESAVGASRESLSTLHLQSPAQTFDQHDDQTTSILRSQHLATENTHEVIFTLASDAAFYQLLSTTLQSLSEHLLVIQRSFLHTLDVLANDITLSARPLSSQKSFRPYSVSSDPRSVRVKSFSKSITKRKTSDLYVWREIFSIYIESSPFENVSESSRGERSSKESEERFKLFVERLTRIGLGQKLKLQQSREGLETFLQLNLIILNLKKFQSANAEAVRKILKKHTKRTALTIPLALFLPAAESFPQSPSPTLSIIPTALPRILVQAIGEILLPIIPHIDDYSCLICTSIAFKPIRLSCGHLFCVRCLVKMQRRGQGDCPLCRAHTVLIADRSNVDWALMNFMTDWFPIEAQAKLRQNEREVAEEEMRELGFEPGRCVVM